jgi:hypothetical protein
MLLEEKLLYSATPTGKHAGRSFFVLNIVTLLFVGENVAPTVAGHRF